MFFVSSNMKEMVKGVHTPNPNWSLSGLVFTILNGELYNATCNRKKVADKIVRGTAPLSNLSRNEKLRRKQKVESRLLFPALQDTL